jgi:hypothetical protein
MKSAHLFKILGDTRDPPLKTRYEAQELKRKQAKES